jgi:hypothetical protein
VVLDDLFSNLRHFTYIISFFRNFRIDFLNNASLATTCCYAKSGQKREQSLRQESLNLIPCGDFSDWHKVVLFDVDIDKMFAKRGSSPTARVGICARMKVITKPILSAVIEIRVLKQTSAIYFFKVGILDLGMTKMKRQSKPENKMNFNFSCFRGMYIYCKY